ncbi:MAG: hypothetical protein LBS69_08310 [Prevotellaceae bacterium]|jgi:hypothetical protein|nr:hypothetical protein [Prevotellaceae bacterium]
MKKNLLVLTCLSIMTIISISACSGGKQKSAETAQAADSIKTEQATKPATLEMTVTHIVANGFFPGSDKSNYNPIAGESKGNTIETNADIEKWFDGKYSSVTMPEGQSLYFDKYKGEAACMLADGSCLLYKVIFDDKTYEVKIETGMKLKYVLSPEGYAKIIYDTAYCKAVE